MTQIALNTSEFLRSSNMEGDCKIYAHTGNIANWNNLKTRRTNDIPANELYQSLLRVFGKWSEVSGPLGQGEIYVNCSNAEKMDINERGLLKVTAKVFLHTLKVDALREAVNITLMQLGVSHLDSLYLALPPIDESTPFNEAILPFWEEMERLRDAGISTQISSCDLDKEKLESLIRMVRIKPEVNQVNLTSCCHMPEDLVAYAKEANVVLHTHGDQSVMLPEETLDQLIHTIQPADKRQYSTEYVVRYAVVVKCRGVIKGKGYIAVLNGKDPQ
ncbi:glutamate--cysteine ligase regulatory subunit [Hydra vulgaris]|uniref:GCS light chain n=2 Tax=Hydra vulgaris TaxID=6087 RepID=A0ABM4DJQ8_HYDVU|nr:glutamate--cysteine ligase regulatory subunit [Hydra vulgaris]